MTLTKPVFAPPAPKARGWPATGRELYEAYGGPVAATVSWDDLDDASRARWEQIAANRGRKIP